MAPGSSTEELKRALEQYLPRRAQTVLGGKLGDAQAAGKLFPDVNYTAAEEKEIQQELEQASNLAAGDGPGAQPSAEALRKLNTSLADRTLFLGAKPSVADVVLYARLAPLVKSWSREQRTGEQGHHNIVRYVDFVQNTPVLGLEIPESEKVPIDANDVAFVPKPVDLKAEKERKKKEKNAAAAAAAGGGTAAAAEATGKTGGGAAEGKSKKEKAKEAVANVKGAITGDLPKREKKEKPAKQPKQPAAKELVLTPALIDLRVGHILRAVQHPNADSLYVSTIAVGDPAGTDNTEEYEGQVVRTVCSGLNGLVPLEEMQGRKIVAVCNLKPVTMRGVKSSAMVLAASPRPVPGAEDHHGGPVELVNVPSNATAGQRIWFEGWEGEPEGQLNPKKKIWEQCQLGFTTTDDLGVAFAKAPVEALQASADKPAEGRLRVKDGGYCTVKSLKGATVR